MTGKTLFDMKAAVAEARLDYPAETNNISFIDITSPFARLKIWKTLHSMSREMKAELKDDCETTSLWRVASYVIAKRCCALKDPVTGRGLLAMSPVAGKWPFSNPHFSFSHELGHLVLPEGSPQSMEPLQGNGINNDEWDDMALKNGWETPADVFAALRCLRKNTLTVREIADIAQNRAIDIITDGDMSYATTHALDGVIAYAGDAPLSLTPQEIKAVASEHARKCRLEPPSLFIAAQALSGDPQQLMQSFNTAIKGSYLSHASAHVLAAIFNNPEQTALNGNDRAIFTAHLKTAGLDKIVPLKAGMHA